MSELTIFWFSLSQLTEMTTVAARASLYVTGNLRDDKAKYTVFSGCINSVYIEYVRF